MSDKKNFLKKRLHKDSVVNQVVEQITDSIIAGNLQPGDKLPTEPELCENFGLEEILCVKPLKFWKRMGWFT